MEEVADLQHQEPKISSNVSKAIYLVIFGILIFTILSIATYFFIIKSKTTSTPSKPTASKSAMKKEEPNVGYVNGDGGLNLRKEADGASLVLLILPNNTELNILSSQGDWYFVEANTKGFVNKKFVSFDKPKTGILKTFSNPESPFNFLYPDVYKIDFTKSDTDLQYSFSGNDSFGGFKVQTEKGLVTLGNYSLKNYPQAAKGTCDVRFAASRKECEKLETSEGTLYLLLIDTTLYKITYLKTQGGVLTDINNLVFSSLVFK